MINTLSLRAKLNPATELKQLSESDGQGLTYVLDQNKQVAKIIFRGTFKGNRTKNKIGEFPIMSIAEANSIRDEILKGMLQDISPRETLAKLYEFPLQATFEDIALQYYEVRVKPYFKSHKSILSNLRCHILPHAGKIKIAQFLVRDFERLMYTLRNKSVQSQAFRTTKYIVEYAIQNSLIKSSPILTLRAKNFGIVQRRGGKPLALHDIEPFFTRCMDLDLGRENILFILLAIAFVCRKQELAGARKSEFDLKNKLWHLPAKRNYKGYTYFTVKNGISIAIPIAEPFIPALTEIFAMHPDSDFLFPARKKSKSPCIDESTINKIFKQVFNEFVTNVHGKRHTGSTILAFMKVPSDIRNLCMNHREKDCYSHYERIDERRTAHEELANYLQPIIERFN